MQKILGGEYEQGERLPSVRDLAQEAAVNPNTVQRALSELEKRGLVVTHRASGRSVTEDADALESARRELALTAARQFLQSTAALGYGPEEAAGLLQAVERGE